MGTNIDILPNGVMKLKVKICFSYLELLNHDHSVNPAPTTPNRNSVLIKHWSLHYETFD